MINCKVKEEEKAEEVVQPRVVNATSSTTSALTIIGIASLEFLWSAITLVVSEPRDKRLCLDRVKN